MASAGSAQAARQLVLIDSDSWIHPGDDFTFDVQLIGEADDANLDVVLYEPITTRTQLHDGLATSPVGVERARGSVELAAFQTSANRYQVSLPGERSTTGRLTLPTIARLEPGVHEVELMLRLADGPVEDRLLLHIIVVPPERTAGPPLATSLIVPFRAPPSLQADGTTVMSRDTIQQLEDVADALASVPGVPVTVDLRPETTEALASLGTQRATQLLDRLRLSLKEREVLATPFVAIDIDRWLSAGLASDVADQLGQGLGSVTSVLDAAPPLGVWLADDDIQAESLTYLVSVGYERGIVLNEESVDLGRSGGSAPSDGQRFEIVDSNGIGQPAFLADAAIQSHFDRTGNDIQNAHAMLADLAVVALANRTFERGIIIRPPNDNIPRRIFLEHLLDGMAGNPLLEPMTTTELFAYASPAMLASDSPDGPPIQRDLTAGPIEPIGLTRLRGEAQSALVSIANVLPEPFDTTPELSRLLLVSASSDLNQSQQEAYLRAIIDRIRMNADAISATAPARVTLSSREGIVPITIRNASEANLQILVSLASDKLSFPDGARTLQTVPPGVTELDLRVQARTSGDAALDITLLSPDRGIELESTRVAVRSTALSRVGVVIAAVALAFLFVWWFRNLRSGKRQAMARPASNVEPSDLLVAPGSD